MKTTRSWQRFQNQRAFKSSNTEKKRPTRAANNNSLTVKFDTIDDMFAQHFIVMKTVTAHVSQNKTAMSMAAHMKSLIFSPQNESWEGK